MKQLNAKTAEYEGDNLIIGVCPACRVGGAFLAANAGELKRGSALAKNAQGKLELLGKTEGSKPYGILADDVSAGAEETPVTVYIGGKFNTNRIITAEGYTMTESDLDVFRTYGIEFTAALEY